MAEKKDRSRFSIKFNENDPAHKIVICLLEKQGPHSKASFIANAVLHYIHCPEAPDISQVPIVEKDAVESMILEILKHQGIIQIDSQTTQRRIISQNSVKVEMPVSSSIENRENAAIATVNAVTENDNQIKNRMDDRMRNLIASTMSAFRND